MKKLELSDIQQVYGNVNGDANSDGTPKINTIDASMVQRFAVKKINTIGKRIIVTFVIDGEEEEISLSIGKDIDEYHNPKEGYSWSLKQDEYVAVDFTKLTEDTIVYLVPAE